MTQHEDEVSLPSDTDSHVTPLSAEAATGKCDKETEEETETGVTKQPTTSESATVPPSTATTYQQIANDIQAEGKNEAIRRLSLFENSVHSEKGLLRGELSHTFPPFSMRARLKSQLNCRQSVLRAPSCRAHY